MKIILILSAVLLFKQSLGRAVELSASLTPAGEAFHNAVIGKFAALAEEPIKLYKKLMEDIYADNLNKFDPKVTRSLAELISQFEIVEISDEAVKIEMFLKLIGMFDLINGVAISDFEEREVIEQIKVEFDRHNFSGVSSDFQSKFDEFIEWLTQELQAKGDKLTANEKEAVRSFRELCRRFKTETDFKKKDALSNDIVAIFK